SLGLLDGDLGKNLEEKAKNLIKIAKNNCERLVRLINDLLDIQKIESGKMAYKMEALNLKSLINQSLESNQALAKEHGVQLVLKEMPKEEVIVYADSDALIQVLTNLLSNAIKFSLQNSHVDVLVKEEKDLVCIAIKDYGSGIPKKFHPVIFQKFSQADSSSTRSKGGTGLGLSISKALVEGMGGKIDFESQENQGTCFHFSLMKTKLT
ncbi:MAG: HAMP domain-containing histidine kinase, partial [Deltaproteobacteria bacterium]|nr:HAMP domain-containing histidine kinase [Deltaproteobacteria bacterium]